MKTLPFLALMAVSAFSFSQSDPEKEDLKRQVEQLKKEQKETQEKFEKRLAELEKKMADKAKKESEPPRIKTEIVNQFRADFDSNANDSAYMRRIEMRFSGQVSPKVSWFVMVDPAKNLRQDANGVIDQSSRILQDAIINYKLSDSWSVDFGQKKIPFSMEALQRTSELDTLERALFLSQGKFGDVRDLGAWINYKQPELEVTAAALNGLGESQNQKDTNEQKSFGVRAVYKPASVKGLQFGAAGVSGTGPADKKKERLGLEAMYRGQALTLKSEVANAITDGKRGSGWYGHVGYKFQPKLEGILRYDTFDPDRSLGGDDTRDWILGVNYFVQGYETFLQFNVVNRRNGDGSRRTLWQFGLQTRW